MKKLLLLVMAMVMVGCGTLPGFGRGAVQREARQEAAVNKRLKEIDEAAERGDITEIQRQELKNEALKLLKRGVTIE